MKPKTMILMVVAVVCGLGASYMTSRLLADREETPAEAAPIEKVTLLVAKKNLDLHASLKAKPEDFFTEKQFVKEDAPKDALKPEDLSKLKGKYLKRGLRKGDHVTAEDIIDVPNGLRSLPNGMRAVGIRVNPEQIAGGFASLPGSHVDIVWTTKRGNDSDTFSKLLLEDVIVLAADAQTSSENGAAMMANVVTVALHPDDAIALTLALEQGSIRLVVRNLEDKSGSDVGRVTVTDLVKNHNSKQKNATDIAAIVAPPTAIIVDPIPDKVTPPDAQPQVKLTKVTGMIKNGAELQVYHYWVNDRDEIVPHSQMEQQDFDPVPPPSVRTKSDDKKDDKKNGF